jgi:putative membrane protein
MSPDERGEGMRRKVIRGVVALFLTILAAAFPAAGIAMAVRSGQPVQRARADTIDQRDREFLITIRFANLWEMPMGKLATERGTTKEVKDAGATMLTDHTRLNTVVEQLAGKYGVTLPSKPKATHQTWMNEISGKQGREFDQTFVNRLRAAHGSVFSIIAEVRAGTENQTILDFATQANTIVMKHMTLLEKTGLVTDHGHFSEAGARTTAYPENSLSTNDLVLGGLVFLVVAGATVVTVRTLSAG